MASLVEQQFVENILKSEGERLLKNQGAALAARLHFHSGNIISKRDVDVSSSNAFSGKLVLTHLAYLRFLDMKRVKYGDKSVKRNRRIYNRFVMRHYNSIAYRLLNDLTRETIANIRANFKNE